MKINNMLVFKHLGRHPAGYFQHPGADPPGYSSGYYGGYFGRKRKGGIYWRLVAALPWPSPALRGFGDGEAKETSGPVPREAFVLLVGWLHRNIDKWNFPQLSNESLGGKAEAVKEWLGELANLPWPDDPGEYATFTCDKALENSYKSLNTQVRNALAVASQFYRFRDAVQVKKDGSQFRIAWQQWDAEEPDRSPIQQVFWLRLPYRSLFTEMLILGGRSVASAFGIQLTIHEVGDGVSLGLEARKLVEQLETEADDVEEARRRTAFVVAKASVTDAALMHCLSGYHAVFAGYTGGSVFMDHAGIASQLASAILDRMPDRPLKICVLCAKGGLVTSPLQERHHTFVEGLHRGPNGESIHIDTVECESGAYGHPHSLCSRFFRQGKSAALSEYDAVFAISGDIAEWLVPALHRSDSGKIPKVFAADLTPALLELMRDPDSPLEAICGVDPYAYGRLVVRAAADARSASNKIAVPVVLVTRDEIIKQDIRSYVQLLDEHPRLELDADVFAWQPWMRAIYAARR